MMLNDELQRVQVGRFKEVPIDTNSHLWFIWIRNDGCWDAEAITRPKRILDAIDNNDVSLIFCVWHGNHRTNLFLMDKKDLIIRLIKLMEGG